MKAEATKCETARHEEMPMGCAIAKHEQCAECARCYTCHANALPVQRLDSAGVVSRSDAERVSRVRL